MNQNNNEQGLFEISFNKEINWPIFQKLEKKILKEIKKILSSKKQVDTIDGLNHKEIEEILKNINMTNEDKISTIYSIVYKLALGWHEEHKYQMIDLNYIGKNPILVALETYNQKNNNNNNETAMKELKSKIKYSF